jgi:hypothetical protein
MQEQIKFTQITDIKKCNANIVYDLEVEKDNSYNIDGLIVHNSAVSSLVAYLLDIHRIDPLDKRWNGMPFERFLNTDRNKNKIKITFEDGNSSEFYEDRKIKIIRDDEEIIIEGKELKETDIFIEVCDE